jgi:hypothetical protein
MKIIHYTALVKHFLCLHKNYIHANLVLEKYGFLCMKRFNFIFTGRYLKFWYIAFVIVLAVMFFNHRRLAAVDTFTLIVYDTAGNIVDERDVSRQEAEQMRRNFELPMSKAFIPQK